VLAWRFTSGAVIWIGGSCDPASPSFDAVVCACVTVEATIQNAA
jgi:hypothetical protein